MPKQNQNAFTVLELLIVLTIIGLLLAFLLPSLGAARESARRIQCSDHLRQVGLGISGHHLGQRSLPMGWETHEGTDSAYGWVVPLLPYLEQVALGSTIDPIYALQTPLHHAARNTSLPLMLCPSDITEDSFMLYASDEEQDSTEVYGRSSLVATGDPIPLVSLPTANYVGVFGTIESDDSRPAPRGDGPFIEDCVVKYRDFLRGTAFTLLVGERTMAQVPSTWLGVDLRGEDAAARLVGSALEGINNPLADECDFSSRHFGGAYFLWADGHVSYVTESVDLDLYHQWAKLH